MSSKKSSRRSSPSSPLPPHPKGRNFYCCCKLHALAAAVAVVFFVFQTAALVGVVVLAATDVGDKVGAVIDWLEDAAAEEKDLQAAREFREIRPTLVRRSYDFLAVPITLCIVLMLSDALLLWSAASRQHKILLWPWLVLHAVLWAAAAALLVFCVLIVPKTYIKVLLFLVVCPFLVVFGFCWFVIKCFFNYLRDLNHKEAAAAVYTNHASKQYPLPATVYSTSEGGPAHLWDQPLPIWTSAASAPSSVWDPLYLHDPRYVQPSSLPVPAHQGIPAYYRSPGTRSIGSSRRSNLNPTRLPDGTLVVPLADEDDDNEDLSEIEEETEDSGSHGRRRRRGGRSGRRSNGHYARRSPYGRKRQPTHNGLLSSSSAAFSVSRPSALSDDGTSVVSLSDKYRQQDEVEVFEEFYPVPLPSTGSSSAAAAAASVSAHSPIPVNSTKAAAVAGRRYKSAANQSADSPKTQSTVE